jgi:hypothetical protein
MIGDAEDMRQRLRLTLPNDWFADISPVLDGLLAGLSVVWAGLYDLLQFVRLQSRIQSATAGFLDIAATDFFGSGLARRAQEADDAFRSRLQRAFRRQRGTRAALIDVASEAGFSVRIFEAAQPADTGVYNTCSGLAWNVSGGWGSLSMPFECLVAAQRGPDAVDDALWQGIADAVPAGGVGWLRIEN